MSLQAQTLTMSPVNSAITPVITIASGKGGSGKTTTALALAALLARYSPPADRAFQCGDRTEYSAEPTVLLLDADAQHSASWAVENQIKAGYTPGFDLAQVGPNDVPMIARVDRLGYAWTIIDTAAAIADEAFRAALKVSDLTLMPIPPDPLDIDALVKALTGVVLPSRAAYRVLVTRVDPRRAQSGQDAIDTLESMNLKVMPFYVRELAAHKRSHMEGRPLTSLTGRDRVAAADYERVFKLLLEELDHA